MVQSPVQLPVSGSQSRARGRRVESMVAEQGRPTDPMPPQLKTPYHENSSIVAGVDGVVEPLDLVRFRSRWPPRPGLPPPAGAKRPRRRKRTVAQPPLTAAQRPATFYFKNARATRPCRRKRTVAPALHRIVRPKAHKPRFPKENVHLVGAKRHRFRNRRCATPVLFDPAPYHAPFLYIT